NVYWNLVGPSFFETMGIPVLLGRGIDWADVDGARNVVVVNEALARHFFPNQSPLGRHVIVLSSPDQTQPYEIIGVVGNAKYDNLRDRPPRTMYAPYTMADS